MSEIINKRLRVINLCAATAIVLIVSGAFAGGAFPLYRKSVASNAMGTDLRRQLGELDGLKATLEQVEQGRKATEARLQDAEARLPNSKAMDQFMQQVAKVAEEVGLQVDGMSPKAIKDAGDYKSMPVEITGTGDWSTCYRFLTGLRGMGRLTRLDDMTIHIDKEVKSINPERPVCRIRICISTFMAR